MFRDLILKIKRESGLSTKRLALELGVSKNVIENLITERYGQQEPRFSDGVVILTFARELGVRV
jgi:ribosome-binding protein aMBF1 (putative translation factor)